MSICLDLRPLQTASSHAGIGTYCYNLVKHLLRIAPLRELQYLTLKNYKWVHKDLISENVSINAIFRPRRPERLHAAYDYMLLQNMDLGAARVLHMLQPSTFTAPNCSNVVTLYDLIPLKYPKQYLGNFDVRKLYEIKLRMLSRCDKIICISGSVRDDAISLLNLDNSKLVVVPLGVDVLYLGLQNETENARFTSEFGIKKPYILNIGGFDFRKNVISAVKAFLRCDRLHKDFQMVIVGKKTAGYCEILEVIQSAGKPELFVFTGALTREQIKSAYRKASIFIYPSLYEGFGLPPLEAMASGVPTITSNTSSLPEVVGDAAIKVNPVDIDEIAHALETLAKSCELRAKLVTEGYQQVSKFSWEQTARLTDAVYRQLH